MQDKIDELDWRTDATGDSLLFQATFCTQQEFCFGATAGDVVVVEQKHSFVAVPCQPTDLSVILICSINLAGQNISITAN